MRERRIHILINIIGVMAFIAAIVLAAMETKYWINKIDWVPTEVYEMTNQHISWD